MTAVEHHTTYRWDMVHLYLVRVLGRTCKESTQLPALARLAPEAARKKEVLGYVGLITPLLVDPMFFARGSAASILTCVAVNL